MGVFAVSTAELLVEETKLQNVSFGFCHTPFQRVILSVAELSLRERMRADTKASPLGRRDLRTVRCTALTVGYFFVMNGFWVRYYRREIPNGVAVCSPYGRVRLQKHHTVMFLALRMTRGGGACAFIHRSRGVAGTRGRGRF